MVNIKLDNEFCLVSDSNNWIIGKYTEKRVSNVSYHTSMISAIESYFEVKLKDSNTKSIHEFIGHQKALLTSLNKALQPLEIKLEVKKLTSPTHLDLTNSPASSSSSRQEHTQTKLQEALKDD